MKFLETGITVDLSKGILGQVWKILMHYIPFYM